VIAMPRAILIALLTLLALTGPASAALASGRDVLDDCTDDEVMQKTYTQKEYRDALKELAGDTDQYGNCRDVIKRAQLKAAAGSAKKDSSTTAAPAAGADSGGGSGAIGSAPAREQLAAATPTERRAVEQARTDNQAVDLDNATVDPARDGTVPGVSRVSDLPTPLAVVIALLLVAALALAALRFRSFVNSRDA
jgi:hypothetical protein